MGVPPPYSPPNCRTPLGVTHWLAAAPVIWMLGVPGTPPPPPGGAEVLEAPMAPEKTFDRPKAQKKIWPNLLRGRVGGVGHRPSGAELLKGALEPGGRFIPSEKKNFPRRISLKLVGAMWWSWEGSGATGHGATGPGVWGRWGGGGGQIQRYPRGAGNCFC